MVDNLSAHRNNKRFKFTAALLASIFILTGCTNPFSSDPGPTAEPETTTTSSSPSRPSATRQDVRDGKACFAHSSTWHGNNYYNSDPQWYNNTYKHQDANGACLKDKEYEAYLEKKQQFEKYLTIYRKQLKQQISQLEKPEWYEVLASTTTFYCQHLENNKNVDALEQTVNKTYNSHWRADNNHVWPYTLQKAAIKYDCPRRYRYLP